MTEHLKTQLINKLNYQSAIIGNRGLSYATMRFHSSKAADSSQIVSTQVYRDQTYAGLSCQLTTSSLSVTFKLKVHDKGLTS